MIRIGGVLSAQFYQRILFISGFTFYEKKVANKKIGYFNWDSYT